MTSTNTHQPWDEPAQATTPRGWYWPAGTTERNVTCCAGHYLDYGPDYRRYDKDQATQPGTIHCVVIDHKTEQSVAYRFCPTIEQAKAWIEEEASHHGHPVPTP